MEMGMATGVGSMFENIVPKGSNKEGSARWCHHYLSHRPLASRVNVIKCNQSIAEKQISAASSLGGSGAISKLLKASSKLPARGHRKERKLRIVDDEAP